MASLPAFYNQQFRDGDTLAVGYHLFTYETGTTTLKTVYKDQAGGIEHTNPIVLGSDGRAPGGAIFLGSGEYTVTLKTSSDVPVGGASWNDVSGNELAADTLRADLMSLLADKGADLIAIDLATQNNPNTLAAFHQYLNGRTAGEIAAGVTPTNYAYFPYDPRRYGAVIDGAGNYATNIQQAINAAEAAGDGQTVPFHGRYRITSSLAPKAGVNFLGTGRGSGIEHDGCHAFSFSFLETFGNVTLDNFATNGTNCETFYAIYQAGTLDDDDELYGITIKNLLITNVNVGIHFRTVRNCTINNNWIQHVNCGIKLIGKCLVFRISDNKIVKGAGCGTGTEYGLITDYFNFTSGTGNVRPESIDFNDNTVFGFADGVAWTGVIAGMMSGCDIQATVSGVTMSSATSLNIENNYIQVSGASGAYGIYGPALGSVNTTKVTIKNNDINAISTTAGTSVGVQVGTTGVGGNVDGLTVEDNDFSGFTLYDIRQYASGNNHYNKNRCMSSASTQSMAFGACIAGRPTYVHGNDCAKLISFDPSESGLIFGTNVESGNVINSGGTQTLTGPGAVTLMTLRTALVTTGADALTLANGYEGQEKFIVCKTFVGNGTLTPTSLWGGTTVTFTAVGKNAHLKFMDGKWAFVGGTATLA